MTPPRQRPSLTRDEQRRQGTRPDLWPVFMPPPVSVEQLEYRSELDMYGADLDALVGRDLP